MKRAKKTWGSCSIGKPPAPARTTVQVRGRETGGEEKHVIKLTVYAEPDEVAAKVVALLKSLYGKPSPSR